MKMVHKRLTKAEVEKLSDAVLLEKMRELKRMVQESDRAFPEVVIYESMMKTAKKANEMK